MPEEYKSMCARCGEPIVYTDPYWSHIGNPQPKHPAYPHAQADGLFIPLRVMDEVIVHLFKALIPPVRIRLDTNQAKEDEARIARQNVSAALNLFKACDTEYFQRLVDTRLNMAPGIRVGFHEDGTVTFSQVVK